MEKPRRSIMGMERVEMREEMEVAMAEKELGVVPALWPVPG